ncbi:MAG: hypothetical protein KDB80_11265 [Planctomycetes bacterium]|nr:hypothetical protein [Planctomycetota bacterium]
MVRIRSPGPTVNVLAVLVTIFLLEDRSRLVAYQPSSCLCGWPLALVLALVYFVRLVILRPFGGIEPTQPGSWRWSIVPVCALVLLSAAVFPWPMKLRFALSRTEFERALLEVAESGAWHDPRWIGWYRVSHVECDVDGRIHFVVGDSTVDQVAISYLPARECGGPNCRWIDGAWFAVEL